MRTLPLDMAHLVRPIPNDFAPTFEDHGRYLHWKATVDVKGHGPQALELGYHHRSAQKDGAAAGPNHLRAHAWQVTELARLGRMDLLSHALVNRHKARKRA